MGTEIYLKHLNVLYVILFITACATLCSSTEYVPVYMWETKNTLEHEPSPALQQTNANSFKESLLKALKNNPRVIVFAEENLSPEDFAQHNQKGNTPFVNLHKYLSSYNAEYKPYVENPLGAIKDLGKAFTEISLASLLRNFDVPKNDELLIVDLNDAKEEEQRFQMLARHDKIISEIIDNNNDNILAIYTAHHPSWVTPEEVRHRNARSLLQEAQTTEGAKVEEKIEPKKVEGEKSSTVATPEEKPKEKQSPKVGDKKDDNKDKKGEVFGDRKNLLLYVASSPLLSEDGGATFKPVEMKQEACTKEGNDITLTLSGGGKTYEFVVEIQSGGYWRLSNVTSNKVSLSGSDISAPFGFSYHCSNEFLKSGSTVLSLPGIQLQAYVNGKENQIFGDAYDCVGFTSIPIWSGLVVTTILLIILTFGITLMMDIRTMDKFDDAKGKTITINTAE